MSIASREDLLLNISGAIPTHGNAALRAFRGAASSGTRTSSGDKTTFKLAFICRAEDFNDKWKDDFPDALPSARIQ